jgi:hypothetical protein
MLAGPVWIWATTVAALDFKIVHATGGKVWRRDARTGEISVCYLDQVQPVCVPAGDAPGPTALSANRRIVHVVRPVAVVPAPVVIVQPAHPVAGVKPWRHSRPHLHPHPQAKARKWK